jgi:hypothetical protein
LLPLFQELPGGTIATRHHGHIEVALDGLDHLQGHCQVVDPAA